MPVNKPPARREALTRRVEERPAQSTSATPVRHSSARKPRSHNNRVGALLANCSVISSRTQNSGSGRISDIRHSPRSARRPARVAVPSAENLASHRGCVCVFFFSTTDSPMGTRHSLNRHRRSGTIWPGDRQRARWRRGDTDSTSPLRGHSGRSRREGDPELPAARLTICV